MPMTKAIVAMGLVLLTSCATEDFAGYVESLDQCIQHCEYIDYVMVEQQLNDSLNVELDSHNRNKLLREWTNDESFKQLFWDGNISLELSQREYNILLTNLLGK